jgi:hypothetical protein
LYDKILQRACDEVPNDLPGAFAVMCRLARLYVDQRGFRAWGSDYRRLDQAWTLRMLARLDAGEFMRRYLPGDGWDEDEWNTQGPLPPSSSLLAMLLEA